jgi:hypothetical protein
MLCPDLIWNKHKDESNVQRLKERFRERHVPEELIHTANRNSCYRPEVVSSWLTHTFCTGNYFHRKEYWNNRPWMEAISVKRQESRESTSSNRSVVSHNLPPRGSKFVARLFRMEYVVHWLVGHLTALCKSMSIYIYIYIHDHRWYWIDYWSIRIQNKITERGSVRRKPDMEQWGPDTDVVYIWNRDISKTKQGCLLTAGFPHHCG